MANPKHLEILNQGVEVWNQWRINTKIESPDLSGANLSRNDLSNINFKEVILSRSNLTDTKINNADLTGAKLLNSILIGINLSETNMTRVNLNYAILKGIDLINVNLSGASLYKVDLSPREDLILEGDMNLLEITDKMIEEGGGERQVESITTRSFDLKTEKSQKAQYKIRTKVSTIKNCNLNGADLSGCDLRKVEFINSSLISTSLRRTNCLETSFQNSTISNSKVYGISVWNTRINNLKQNNLIITKFGEPELSVDDIEVAQFIYLLLNNQKIRNVISTIAKKGVLILGRFTPERKKILDAIREKLRTLGYVPMMFDFEKVQERDFTETIKILAGLSRFIIADITDPSSVPLELQATVPDYKIPFIPIIQKGKSPFAMFIDLTEYDWMLDLIKYGSENELMKGFQKGIIDRALKEEKRLEIKKTKSKVKTLDITDFE